MSHKNDLIKMENYLVKKSIKNALIKMENDFEKAQ
jgi:hypothetical protein